MIVIRRQKTLKGINRKAILEILRNSEEMSIAELSKKAKLSKTTLMKIMNYYIQKGLVTNIGKGSSTEEGGKKPNIYKFNVEGRYAIGMVISANMLISVATNLNGKILKKISVDLSTDEKFDSVLKKIIDSYEKLVNEVVDDRSKIIGFAIGTYGITDYNKGVIILAPYFNSWGKNIQLKEKILEKLTDKIPVYIDNNNRFQAFAEITMGIAKDKTDIVALKAGKGMGSGVIMENKIKRGGHSIFGEIGHMTINPKGEEICSCGARGCFESMVSTKRIIRMAIDYRNNYPDSLIFKDKKPEDIDVFDVFGASKKNDALALEILDDITDWFATGISNIILLYDPQLVVIQGIYTKAGKYFLENLRRKVNEISLSKIKKESEIKFSKLGEEVGALGAACYVVSEYFN